MITQNGKLLIFENFVVDRKLPKFAQQNSVNMTNDTFQMSTGGTVFSNGNVLITTAVTSNDTTSFVDKRNKLVKWFSGLFKPKPVERPAPQLTVAEFFHSVKNSTEELKIVRERAEGYKRALLDANDAGQHALIEKLTEGLNAHKMETQCLAIGIDKFVDEHNIVDFYKKSTKGLRLDYVANFIRQIPKNVIDKKIKADKIGIFDNYVVLHYDPEGKSYMETQEEIAAKKDPILFGLIKGKRVLYVIGDWIDERCDLTLDQLAEAIGSEAIQKIN